MSSSVVFLGAYRTDPSRLLMLVRRVASDDRAAFTRLYDALLPQVSATVRSVVKDPERAAAVTSAAFVEAWLSADAHTALGTDIAAWITSIATRLAGESTPALTPHPSSLDQPVDDSALVMLLERRSGRRPGRARGRE